ncbi:MAG: hypothetical protein KAR21_25955 [Spirochaetales bacterium]|nr:hypothetical protein [Spirochaetales bacterium]
MKQLIHQHFPVIFLTGRPAAGKSEIIDYLKNCSTEDRLSRFHIADFIEIDDFPMLWTWFEEDALLERMGKPRLHSDKDGYFKYPYLWNLLIERIDMEYKKLLTDKKDFEKNGTAILEFARGSQHGGFKEAFNYFTKEVLEAGAVLYIDVSFEESLRKNRRRFNPDKPHSILEHGLPDEKLKEMYEKSDWKDFSSADDEFITVNSVKIPYAVFNNEDDVTTRGGDFLGDRLEKTLNKLWDLKKTK